jgi:oligosaccharide amylase
MPKALVLGNGNILVCLDAWGQVKDFYFPFVGHENHVGHGYAHKIGVSIDGAFAWLTDPAWEVKVDYAPQTMCSHIAATHHDLGVEIIFSDVVYDEKNIFVRQASIHNTTSVTRTLKLFFHQQFRIYDTSKRDTGYYDPEREIIVHYEGRRVFAIGGRCRGRSFDEYSIGNYGIEGKEGTWKDAEDNRLEGNPIEHGEVDSIISFELSLAAHASDLVHYWVAVDKLHDGAMQLERSVLEKKPEHIIKTTSDFWRAWLQKNAFECPYLDKPILDLFQTSLLVMRTHIGSNGGIIASGDSDMLQFGRDTYAYVWPRDAAYTVLAMDQAGYAGLTQGFFRFCRNVLSEGGYFYQKYRSDESIGSSWLSWIHKGEKRLAIQEDETAIVLFALWRHYQSNLDLEFIEEIYNPLIKKAADFLCAFREKTTGLPEVSSDIWERIFAISTYTSASVYGGLMAASSFAELLGKSEEAEQYRSVAEEVKAAILKHLYNPETGYFHTSVKVKNGDVVHSDSLDSSSFFGLFIFGVLDPQDELMTRAFEFLNQHLTCPTPVGGVVRFLDDEYFRVADGAPSNPWVNITLWKAQYLLAIAKGEDDLTAVRDILHWTVAHASSAGILPEQLHPYTGEPLSAAPLMYSHAEFVATVIRYREKCQEFEMNHPTA